MGRLKQYRYFVGDFETTVYEGQTETEVWASAIVEFGTEDVTILHSIDDTWSYIEGLKANMVVYYHNLKFDGNFWLSYLITRKHMKPAFVVGSASEFEETRKMPKSSFKYCISDKGQWYYIIIKDRNGYVIEILDSLKLLPFSVKDIGKAFNTKHRKLDMEYVGYRYAGCEITDDEKRYIANDVLVVKEALEIMYQQGHNKMTIGSCCLAEYKSLTTKPVYEYYFPDVYDMALPEGYGADNVGEYIKHSYKGGWCYLVRGKENKTMHNGVTADVNSLYPSMMSSESGNRYPVGVPKFWKYDGIPDEALKPESYYFIRIRTRFHVKENYLPFIQIKGTRYYKGTDMLETSDVYNQRTGEYQDFYLDSKGNRMPALVTLTLTCTDYVLLKEHYELYDFTILDGCWFSTEIGIFDTYIEKYKKIKLESKGAMRTLAKLFLNNLYGKMASSKDSSFKLAFEKEDGAISFSSVEQYNKQAGYIPVGSAITSYARNFTIRAAQKNYYGADKAGFIYADTDSIHCDLPPEQLKGVPVHSRNFCCWKLESSWDNAIFVRQKTYIEHIVAEDLEPIETPYYNIKCAGMPQKCKIQMNASMTGVLPEDLTKYTDEQIEFMKTKRTLEDFKIGLKISGKLLPKRIKGGVVLTDTYYEMRNNHIIF